MTTTNKTQRILRLILFLSNSYSKSKEECTNFLEIKDTAFYNYCNLLKNTGFNLIQKEGRYQIDYSEKEFRVLQNILHFTEEENYLLAQAIDKLDEGPGVCERLKNKLFKFLNQDKAIDDYLLKEKNEIVRALQKARREKKQILLLNYSSGNSDSVKNRMVEPFEFKEDFSLIWAFDTALKQNRQFKVCRIQDTHESRISWEYEHLHRSKPVDIFRNTGDLDKQIELMLNLKARNLLIEEYPLAERYLTPIKQNQFILQVAVAKYEGPARFVIGLAENIHIKGDSGFKDFIGKKIKNMVALHETRSRSNDI